MAWGLVSRAVSRWTALCIAQSSLSGHAVGRGQGWSWAPLVEAATQLLHSLARLLVVGDARGGTSPGMEHGRVVASAEVPADRRQRFAGELTRQIHGDLARP